MTKKRKIEIFAVIAVVVIAAVLMFVKTNLANKAAKEVALMDQLRSARMAVGLYLEVNKVFPSNLKLLTTNKFSLGNRSEYYLNNVAVDGDGNPIDAFGNKLNYDSSTGRVWPIEKEYGDW